MLNLAAASTALILIDLQDGIVGLPPAPRPGPNVTKSAIRLAELLLAAKLPVALVHVRTAADFGDALRRAIDRPMPEVPGSLPEDWSVLVDSRRQPGDLWIIRHRWGTFYRTDLDVPLRHRSVKAVVIDRVATNMGVESTARQTYKHGYEVMVAKNATTSLSAEMHAFSFGTMLPILSRVTTFDDIAQHG